MGPGPLLPLLVVPTVRNTRLLFDEMISKQYMFEAQNWKWMKALSDDDGGIVLTPDKKLAERVSERRLYLLTKWAPGAWRKLIEFAQYYGETRKKALVDFNDELGSYKLVSKILHLDLLVGTEKFFDAPFWWTFTWMERGPLWAKSVESLKEAGIIDYFLQLSRSKYNDLIPRGSASANSSVHSRLGLEQDEGLFLTDVVAQEIFVVLLYGVGVATAVFFAKGVISMVRMRFFN